MKDGRFNSYNPSFESYFREEGKIVVGPDYRNEFRFKMPIYPDQDAVTFNLRKSRQGLLFAEHDKIEDYELFLKRFNKTLDAISRSSKQILYLADGKLRKNRFSALEEISNYFPEVNIDPLRRIKDLYHNLEKLDKLYRNSDEAMKVWNSTVTFLEEMIKAYIQRFPD